MSLKKTKLSEQSTTSIKRELQGIDNYELKNGTNRDDTKFNADAIIQFVNQKKENIHHIIQQTIISIQNKKQLDIFSNSEINLCVHSLTELFNQTSNILGKNIKNTDEIDSIIDKLQIITNKLFVVIAGFGTQKIENLLYISFGPDVVLCGDNDILISKFDLIKQYVLPIGCNMIVKKELQNTIVKYNNYVCSDKITENTIPIENLGQFECLDTTSQINKSFYNTIYGIRVVIHNIDQNKTVVINGIIDDIPIDCLITNRYIIHRKNEMYQYIEHLENIEKNDKDVMIRMVNSYSLKDFLIYSDNDIQKKLILLMVDVNFVKNNRVDILIKKFIEMDTVSQRRLLIHLLIYNVDNEIQYISYLLYDLITPSSSENGDSQEQKIIYNSFPWAIKMLFKDSMKYTIKYTQNIVNKYDVNRVSLEQQIFLMRVSENIKDRAMSKLKEIKGKPDDQGSKAKQYLEGLLKIPFGIFKEEPILKLINILNDKFVQKILSKTKTIENDNLIIKKNKYTVAEMMQHLQEYLKITKIPFLKEIESLLKPVKKTDLIKLIQIININFQKYLTTSATATGASRLPKVSVGERPNSGTLVKEFEFISTENISTKSKIDIKNSICAFLETNTSATALCDFFDTLNVNSSSCNDYKEGIILQTELNGVKTTMDSIVDILDSSIYGHSHAKNQILKIIAQWINGKQSGYCFGFEGSPGVGKTSLAKRGLAKCLNDEFGKSRPFAFIALGGSCNGSTLEGHNYTYVNSNWGKIVDTLMESKCMNPIIYIDELDKVSKTEQGKEIIGILTHLIDTTQNDDFQDKYFSGIPFNLSKALFIFSYNDPEQIDRILLDRIHRIKFDNLSSSDKLVIVNNFLLSEINEKMGFENVVDLSNNVIKHIIDIYTMEPGIRKLKEILFDLYGEINIELLQLKNIETLKLPLKIEIADLGTKYLKKYKKITDKKIHSESKIGIINGLWANALGKGGIIQIETSFFPSSSFLELKLTGLQGDVMKESMNVAKTLAWSLTSTEIQKKMLKVFDDTRNQGLHIHCPEGAVSKDGPSAGAAITISIYSLINKLHIKNNFAITGEINLQGEITAIGGLDSKIIGGIRAGIKTFMYPESNKPDFDEYMLKYGSVSDLSDIEFIAVANIHDALKCALK